MQFEERTIKVIIDEEKCLGCTTHVCVDAVSFEKLPWPDWFQNDLAAAAGPA